jgi:hypothetical protein
MNTSISLFSTQVSFASIPSVVALTTNSYRTTQVNVNRGVVPRLFLSTSTVPFYSNIWMSNGTAALHA